MTGKYSKPLVNRTGPTGNWNSLFLFLFVFQPKTGGELFALLEREGVFLEDAARWVEVLVIPLPPSLFRRLDIV